MAVAKNFSKRQKATMKAEALDPNRSMANLDTTRQSLPSGYRYAVVAVDDRGNILPGSEQVNGSLDLDAARIRNQLEQLQHISNRVSEQGASSTETQADEPMCDTVNVPATRSVQTRGRRGLPEHGRQRRRAMPHRPTTPMLARPSSSPERAMPEIVAAPCVERKVTMALQPQKQMKSFRIDNTAAVEEFLRDRLKRMQQLADKKIAKAWIKGICPKKQAKFPYQNNKQEKACGKKPDVPAWWPDTETVCRFVEPDHIRREERMGLCLHLLRLRPSPAQLEEWNNGDTAASKTHSREGWTLWLKKLAGPEIFEELAKEGDHRIKHRQRLMEEMYNVAYKEEDYLDGGIDGHEKIFYEDEEEERKPITSKRSRRTSSSAASTPDVEESTPSSTSSSCTRAVTKRAKRESVVTAPVMERCASDRKDDLEMLDVQNVVPLIADQDRSVASSFCESFNDTPRKSISRDKVEPNIVPVSYPNQSRALHHMHGLPRRNVPSRGYSQPPPQWRDNSMPAYNEQQQQGGSDFQHQAQLAPNTFPGRQDFEFPQFQPHFDNQIHMNYMPQPELQSTPSTPVYSPAGMASMPMDTFSMQHSGITTDQQYAMMAPSHYLQPALRIDATVADFHPHVNMAAPQYQHPYQQQPGVLAQRHIAPMQNMQQGHGMPMPQQPMQYHHHTRR